MQTLASLRILVLSYLADLEARLGQLESPLGISDVIGERTVEEAAAWTKVALEMLDNIRTDVCSHLPELHFSDISVESVKAHLPDMPDVRSHFQDMSDMLPDFTSAAAEMRLRLDDVRSRFSDIDINQPLSYVPTLSEHLQSLHAHLSHPEITSGIGIPSLPQKSMISDVLDSILHSEVLSQLIDDTTDALTEGEDLLERAAKEVAAAVKRSFEGARLIKYSDLPEQWRNNRFVVRGYR